jgi:uncharacterized OB-fold protein
MQKTCENCGQKFSPKYPTFYCSTKCADEHLAKLRREGAVLAPPRMGL